MIELLTVLVFIGFLFLIRFFFFRWASGEELVFKKLESLRKKNEEYHPFNNVILKTLDGTTQIDHILISPYGVFVIETKDYKGWIFGDAHQKRWTQSLYTRFYDSVKYHFQNPIHQNYKHVKAVQDFLKIDAKFIFNVVVFTGYCEFKTEMPENVRGLRDLVPYIKYHTEKFFSPEKTEELAQKLNDYVENSPLNEDDHFKSLAENMMHPICPKCGKPMVLRTARKGSNAGSEFWGCPNFPSCRVTKPVAYSE